MAPGDRVATLLPNSLPCFEAYFAAAGLGAILVPLNTRLHPDELGFILRDSGSRVLLADPSLGELVGAVLARETPVQCLLSSASPFPTPTRGPAGAYPDPDGRPFAPALPPADAVAHLYYTSSTRSSTRAGAANMAMATSRSSTRAASATSTSHGGQPGPGQGLA